MTHFLQDILRQPEELKRSLTFLTSPGREALRNATSMLQQAQHIFLTGIGSSWHAAQTAATLFYENGRPVYLADSAELLYFSELPAGSVVIMLSRTGRSVEIVRLISKVHASGSKIIALTNSAESPLAQRADVGIVLDVAFDHAISVNTYSTLALAAGVLAADVVGRFEESVAHGLLSAIADVQREIPDWILQIEKSPWPAPEASYYFLARGSSLGTCQETRLLWEEGVKTPATAMSTASFRHGPQEIVAQGTRFGMWIDGRKVREQDLNVARDLSRMGAQVALIGQNLEKTSAELVFSLPPIAPEWQFVIDVIPGQLLAERLSRLRGVDCDSFRYCSFIVEEEGGLLLSANRIK